MWGADDPDPRKPIVWPDLPFEDEASDPFGRPREPDRVAPDLELRDLYKRLIALRRAHTDLLVDGAVRVLAAVDPDRVLVYERVLGDALAVIAFNASDRAAEVTVNLADGPYPTAFGAGADLLVAGGSATLRLGPRSAVVWIRD
jgi:glycosidase